MSASQPPRPSPEEIRLAHGRTVPDVIAPGLKVLFCGINPGLYSGAVGHHFARPGNRFWPVLHAAGYTARRLYPHEEQDLLPLGYGITNLVARATAGADELSSVELAEGGCALLEKVARYRPAWVAILGIGAYRSAFSNPKAALGEQPDLVGSARLWVLPNPSGLNAHYDLEGLVDAYRKLKLSI